MPGGRAKVKKGCIVGENKVLPDVPILDENNARYSLNTLWTVLSERPPACNMNRQNSDKIRLRYNRHGPSTGQETEKEHRTELR